MSENKKIESLFLKDISDEIADIIYEGKIIKDVFYSKDYNDEYDLIFGPDTKKKEIIFDKSSPYVAFHSSVWRSLTKAEKLVSIKWYNEKISQKYKMYEPAIIIRNDKREFKITSLLNLGKVNTDNEFKVGQDADEKRLLYVVNINDLDNELSPYEIMNYVKVTNFNQMLNYAFTKKYHNMDIDVDKNLKEHTTIRPDLFNKDKKMFNEKDEAVYKNIRKPIKLSVEEQQVFSDIVTGYSSISDTDENVLKRIAQWGSQPIKMAERVLFNECSEEMSSAEKFIDGKDPLWQNYKEWKGKNHEFIDKIYTNIYGKKPIFETSLNYYEKKRAESVGKMEKLKNEGIVK